MKKRLYAASGIPVYWIINLLEGRFEVYTEPSGAGESPDYRHLCHYGPSDTIPVVIEGIEVGHLAVRELLP